MNDFIGSSSEKKTTSFWKRPEGVVGLFFLGGIGIAGAMLLNKILPWIITLLENTLYTAFLFGVVGVLLFLLTNKRVHNLVSFMFKLAMRQLTGMFIAINPIEILKIYVSELREKIELIDQNLSALIGQIDTLTKKIDDQKQQISKEEHRLKVAKEMNETAVVRSSANKISQLTDFNGKLSTMLQRMITLKKVITKIREASVVAVDDISFQIKMKEEENKYVNSSWKAIKSASAILNGSDSKEIYDQAIGYIDDDLTKKVGEIKLFIESSDSIIKGIDINNLANERDILQRIDELENKSMVIAPTVNKQETVNTNSYEI